MGPEGQWFESTTPNYNIKHWELAQLVEYRIIFLLSQFTLKFLVR
jgi:hypothetical protein